MGKVTCTDCHQEYQWPYLAHNQDTCVANLTKQLASARAALVDADSWLTSMKSLDLESRIEHAVDIIRAALKA